MILTFMYILYHVIVYIFYISHGKEVHETYIFCIGNSVAGGSDKKTSNANMSYNIITKRGSDLLKNFSASSKAENYLKLKENKSLLDVFTDSQR